MTAQTDSCTVTIIPLEGPADALYHRYPGQTETQGCFIALSLTTGQMWAGWNGEIGNAVPATVWHGLVRRYPIPPLQPRTVNRLMGQIAPYAQTVLDHSEIVWDGSNHVARLDQAAVDAEEQIAGDGGIVGSGALIWLEPDVHAWDAGDWLEPIERDILRSEIAAGADLGALYDEYQGAGADEEHPVLDGLMPYLERLAADVRAEAAE